MASSLPFELDTVDHIPGDVCAEDENYLYVVDNSNNLDRFDKSTGILTEIASASAFAGAGPIAGSIRRLSTGTFVCQAADAGNSILRSADGVTWSTVSSLDGTILASRGLDVIELSDGSEAVIFGTYITNPGGDLRLLLLTSDGTVSTILNTWAIPNPATSNVQDCHVVRQDPYTKQLWVGFGDTNDQCGILIVDQDKINDTSAWANIGDLSLDDIDALNEPGFTVIRDGTQKYRSTDFAFFSDRVEIFSDAATSSQYRGILAIDRSTNLGYYVDRKLNSMSTDYSGFWSLAIDSEQSLHIPYVSTSTPTTAVIPMFSGRGKGLTYQIGQGHMNTVGSNEPAYNASTTYAVNDNISYNGFGYTSLQSANTGNTPDSSPAFWQLRGSQFNPRCFWKGLDDRIYLSGTPMAGTNSQKATYVFKKSDRVFSSRKKPDNYWPAYWASPTGSNSGGNLGVDPRNPVTIEKFIKRGFGCGAYMPGSRLILLEGSYATSQNNDMGDYRNGTFTFQSSLESYVQVIGQGEVNITWSGGYFIAPGGAVDFKIRFSNINSILSSGGAKDRMFLGSATRNTEVYFDNVKAGSTTLDVRRIFEVVNEDLTIADRCVLATLDDTGVGNHNNLIEINEVPANQCRATVEHSILKGGYWGVLMGQQGELTVRKSTIKDYGRAGVLASNAGTLANTPNVKNTVIHSSNSGGTPFEDDENNLTWSDIDYNLYDKYSSDLFRDVSAPEHGLNSTVDPNLSLTGYIFVDPANDDYTPIAGRSADMRGISSSNPENISSFLGDVQAGSSSGQGLGSLDIISEVV